MAGALGTGGMAMPSFAGLTTGGLASSAATPNAASTLPGTTTPAAAAPTPAFTGAPATAASMDIPPPTNGANPTPLTPPSIPTPDVQGTNLMGMPSWFQDMLNAKGGAWGEANGTVPAPAPVAAAVAAPKPVAKPVAKPVVKPAAAPPPLIGNQWDPRYGAAPTVTGYTAAQMAAGKGPTQTTAERFTNPALAKQLADWARWNTGEDAYGAGVRSREAEAARQAYNNQQVLGGQR